MSQHIQLYQAVMSLLEAIADNPQTHQLLVLPVHDKQDTNQASSSTLATVLKKLEGIAHSYSKTMRWENGKFQSLVAKLPSTFSDVMFVS